MRKFKIFSTPAILIFAPDGIEIDWHLGYAPPPNRVLADLKNSIRGIDTAKSLSEAFARNPEDVETIYKLAKKYYGRFTEKAFDLYQKIVILDPEGKKEGRDTSGSKVVYTESAEYWLAFNAATRNNFEPLKDYIAKYPNGTHVLDAYRMFAYNTPLYWDEYVARAPHGSRLLLECLMRVRKDKTKLDGAIKLAEELWGQNPSGLDASTKQVMAELYMIKGEPEMAELLYGGSFLEGELELLTRDLWRYGDFWISWKKYPERALAAAEAIPRIIPEDAGARYQAARLLIAAGSEAKALDIFGPKFAVQNWDSPADLVQYSHFWAYRDKYLDKALSAAKRAVELDPSRAESWHELGFVLWKTMDIDGAIKAEEEAIKLANSAQKSSYKRQLELIKKAKVNKK